MPLLTENDVVHDVCGALSKCGWTISSFASTSQTGIDIVAARDGVDLFIEAKGITSALTSSSRYGVVQTRSQIFIQVAAALLKSAELRCMFDKANVAIAVPAHPSMRRRLEPILKALEAIRVGVFWVSEDHSVVGWNTPWYELR